jgi:oligopeptide/dipeptide ABC transporter ATP-binding protein
MALLHIEDLVVTFPYGDGYRRVLDGVSLSIEPGEVLGLVGESGSGKSMTALSVMGLLPRNARISGGSIRYKDQNLLHLSGRKMASLRGSEMAMVFQNPRAALNPLMQAGNQVARVVRHYENLPKTEAYERALELLTRVGIADARNRASAYPHQLSGGMAQRVLIAMMLACQPQLLIADEPTTGLDVTIQAQIFELIKDIHAETGAALLLITHDLGVVSEVCQRVAVMYAGQVMEVAPLMDLFERPQHPYTKQLMESILRVDQPGDLDTRKALQPGAIRYDLSGCHFANRCPLVHDPCWNERPMTVQNESGHAVNCHLFASTEDFT